MRLCSYLREFPEHYARAREQVGMTGTDWPEFRLAGILRHIWLIRLKDSGKDGV